MKCKLPNDFIASETGVGVLPSFYELDKTNLPIYHTVTCGKRYATNYKKVKKNKNFLDQ